MTDGASGSFPQAPPAPSLVGTVLDGRYRIMGKLGEGGMGEVYAAQHVHIDKKYAIKLLKAEIVSNQEAVARFRQEALKSSEIKHRNIIAIEDFNQLPDGRIYMCMELLNGAALNDMIQQPMSADRLLNILIQTGHGLAAAHARGIVHRDMKPENIFVTVGPQGEDVPKILDFGIAKVSGNDGGQNHLTRTGTIFGTPFYMAPEQALGNPVDNRTDIYAMGVIMYECFAGSLPFQGESFMGILTQHITTEPEPVAQRAANAGRQLPMGLAEIITRCMNKNPAQRYQTMDELVNALIAVYRGIAGPGMSTYMEAFPVGATGHQMQPTPPPMTGAHNFQTPPTGGVAMMPTMAASQSAPVVAAQSGVYDPGSSSVVAPKKSKMGIVIAIIALLAVGGGVTAFVLMSNKDDKKPADGPGSQVAVVTGSDKGSDTTTKPSGGSDTIKSNGSSDVVVKTGSGSDVAGSNGSVGSGSGSSATVETPPPPTNQVEVAVVTNPPLDAYEIWENGKKLQDGTDDVPVTKGEPRKLVVHAKGYKDAAFTLDGTKKRFMVRLVPATNGTTHTQSGSSTTHTTPPPPPKKDCSSAILDPKDKRCRDQYCAAHEDEPRCQAE